MGRLFRSKNDKRNSPLSVLIHNTNLILLFVSFLSFFPWGVCRAAEDPLHKPFIVFDGTLYKGKPDTTKYGIKPITIYYVSKIWDNWHKGVGQEELPKEGRMRFLASEAKKKNSPVVFDIEHWSLRDSDDSVVSQNVRKFITIINWVHDEEPELTAGFFGVMPVADYSRSRKGFESSEYKKWQTENDRLKPLAAEVDLIFPYIYTFQPNKEEWTKFAIENIKEAKRYGKPVYVFLWPQYSEKNKELALQYIPADFWKLQLETALQHADGIVIWGGWGDGKPAEWDDNAPWWIVTKEFMNGLPR